MKDLFGEQESADEAKKERPPVKTPKRQAILSALRERGILTLDEAVEIIGGNIYHNERFHVGNLLSAMVKAKMINRVKPGLFSLP